MTDLVGIYNMALSRVGVSKVVGSPTEASAQRRACSRWYEHSRDFVLRDFPWNFATRSIQLATSTETFLGYQYVYGYPADAVNVLGVADVNGLRHSLDYVLSFPERIPFYPWRYAWKVVSHSNGTSRLIVTDLPEAYAIYTQQHTDTESFPPDFVSCLAWKLAANIGAELQASANLIQTAEQMYLLAKGTAGANSLNEERPDQEAEGGGIRARA